MKFQRSHSLYALAVAAGLVGLAMAPSPGIWRILDDSRIAFSYPKTLGNIGRVKVINDGVDDVTVSVAKGKPVMVAPLVPNVGANPVPAGTFAIFDLPLPMKQVVIEDDPLGPDPDPNGAKGTLLWLN